MTGKRRVLFFAEPATLAHVARPIVLAGALDGDEFEVCIATGADFRHHVKAAGLNARDLWCIGTRAYVAAVNAGRPVFSYKVLQRYVEDDLRVIAEFQPDIVVGDFRLSLAVSARLARKPYVAISNAYWSPFAEPPFDVPVHAATKLVGAGFANRVFHMLRPFIFAQHSLPMHRLRRQHDMPSLGLDLRRIFTEGDVTLFADVPELVPTLDPGLGRRYQYIGPVTWSPPAPLPAAMVEGSDARPLVYVSMGSSGDSSVLDVIVSAVVASGCRAAVAAPGRLWTHGLGDNVVVADMLPGREVAAMASLAICNGGSPGVHQALQQGTPVLGIPANLDQLLNMHFVVRSGAGLALRADQVSPATVARLLQQILSNSSFRQRAHRVQAWFGNYRAGPRFEETLSRISISHSAPLS
jgi:UDP:flavonoid glycosyltransferase YjiC (YdhE family)